MLDREVYWYGWCWYVERHKLKHSGSLANPKQDKYKENNT